MGSSNKKVRDGGIKTLVLWTGGIMAAGSAEAFKSGDYQTALMLMLAGGIAYAIHEAMAQYQFTWDDEFVSVLANNTDLLEQDEESGELNPDDDV